MDSNSAFSSSARAETLRVLGVLLRTSCDELMADYGVAAAPHTCRLSTVTKASFGAAIAFGGTLLGGCLALTAHQEVIAATAGPLPGPDIARERALSDWTCELANQLLGRMKNKLRSYDVPLETALPHLADPTLTEQPEHDVCYRFACEHGLLSGYLDVRVQPGLVLIQSSAEPEQLKEGELILF